MGKKLLKILIVIVIAMVVLVGVEVFISYKCLTITDYNITSDHITNDMKVILISDLHNGEFGNNNRRLIRKIEKQKPDLIIMAGDMLNGESENSQVPCNLIKQLKNTAPVYYAWGNHELEYIDNKTSDLKSELEDAGAIVLDEEYKDIKIKGNSLRIGGIYAYAFGLDGYGHMKENEIPEERLHYLKEFQKTNNFRLMMAHRPDSFVFGDTTDYWNMDLVVSGHLHGGQVIIPGKGGLYGGDLGWFPEYASGLYHFDGVKNMIITRGLGSDTQKLPRFNNVPEIVVINLKKG